MSKRRKIRMRISKDDPWLQIRRGNSGPKGSGDDEVVVYVGYALLGLFVLWLLFG